MRSSIAGVVWLVLSTASADTAALNGGGSHGCTARLDFLVNSLLRPVGMVFRGRPPARNVDVSGEVQDSPWYTNRHGASKCDGTRALVRGPGDSQPPSELGKWTVLAAKKEGVTPGFTIKDSRGRKYLLKFDPPGHPELATGSDVVVSKFFYALGYNVPENYIVTFERERLVPGSGKEKIEPSDIEVALAKLTPDANGRYRAVASRFIEGKLLGPFSFTGVRRDDPNDTIPHQHRRELRGLFVMSAWLNHTDVKSGNTLDSLVTECGVQYVKHYLIDFGAALGSASLGPKGPRDGYESLADPKYILLRIVTLNLYKPRWVSNSRVEYPSVGRFGAESFDPRKWKPHYPNPAFFYRRREDDEWAARKVAALTEDEIRAIVATGQYSNPDAAAAIASVLIARRDKIAAAFMPEVDTVELRARAHRAIRRSVHAAAASRN